MYIESLHVITAILLLFLYRIGHNSFRIKSVWRRYDVIYLFVTLILHSLTLLLYLSIFANAASDEGSDISE